MARSTAIRIGLLLAFMLTAASSPAQQIGVVASVEPDMRGRAPGGSASVKAPGTGVVANETIVTTSGGRGQILFLDQTTLTISPNSEIVLDGFVFDPGGSGGKSGLSLTRGALRFIGGKNSRTRDATIRTPTAIIGVRGSSALVSFEDGRTRAVLIAGDRLCVAGIGGDSSCTNRQGGIMTEQGYAGQVGQAELVQTIGKIDGPPRRGATFQATQQAGATGQSNGQQGQQGTQGAGVASGVSGLREAVNVGLGGGTGITDATDPRSGPVSSRGELRDFQVFDDDVRSDAIVGITTGGADPPPAAIIEEVIETMQADVRPPPPPLDPIPEPEIVPPPVAPPPPPVVRDPPPVVPDPPPVVPDPPPVVPDPPPVVPEPDGPPVIIIEPLEPL